MFEMTRPKSKPKSKPRKRKQKQVSFTAYEREPIKIGNGSVMLLQMFKGQGYHLEDVWAMDLLDKQHYETYSKAARQFIMQLEGEATIAFYMALRDQLNVEIKNWRQNCRRRKK